jgi:hypothetical protein
MGLGKSVSEQETLKVGAVVMVQRLIGLRAPPLSRVTTSTLFAPKRILSRVIVSSSSAPFTVIVYSNRSS